MATTFTTPKTIGPIKVCSICETVIPNLQHNPNVLGYAYLPDKVSIICYSCCADKDKERMRDTGKITLYLDCERWREQRKKGSSIRACMGTVQNWPGSLKIPCFTTCGNHNIARTRYDVWFKFEGYEWWGVCYGEDTQLVHCKRTKKKV